MWVFVKQHECCSSPAPGSSAPSTCGHSFAVAEREKGLHPFHMSPVQPSYLHGKIVSSNLPRNDAVARQGVISIRESTNACVMTLPGCETRNISPVVMTWSCTSPSWVIQIIPSKHSMARQRLSPAARQNLPARSSIFVSASVHSSIARAGRNVRTGCAPIIEAAIVYLRRLLGSCPHYAPATKEITEPEPPDCICNRLAFALSVLVVSGSLCTLRAASRRDYNGCYERVCAGS